MFSIKKTLITPEFVKLLMVLGYQKAELLKNTRRKFCEVKSSVDDIKSTVVGLCE